MYYEVNLIEAIMAHHNGKKGFSIKTVDGEEHVITINDFMRLFDDTRFVIDDTRLS